MFKRILIANRGEIAMRVLRCCQEMGIETVLACSAEDMDSLPAQFATKRVCIGPSAAAKSYLNQEAVVQAAMSFQCEAIHPGYGFLSENADFASLCEEHGILFIGPSPEMIRMMGDKQSARALMKKHGVPVVPGSDGILKNWKEAAEIARKVGYPVLLKATAGGGGRGMRTAYDASEIQGAYESAQAEALSAFGDGSLYLEKLILHPHHIEVQILGDSRGHIIHLGERDCSLQRRNQKLLEEAPARILKPRQREALHRAALRAAKAVRYRSAGTVEFVLDREGNFYFIEMNTRIQVEHPVTEMITGVDLVREQIRIAAGLELSCRQSDISFSGHAIECRINAENPAKGFAPCPGNISFLHFPAGKGVRVESALYNGSRVSPWYDSMIAKVIVHAPGRLEAIRKMRVALEEMTVEGINTNLEFLYLLMFNPDYLSGHVDTGFLEKDADAIIRWGEESRRKA
ncbi:MAG: acetyl-CoA carboxylase biotin carboxylase subunit [Eubacterium sp.]|jgi:acetyl-CoA carboxylase biotin carboxylase subunit|nr:acetyl-CoA carboxylase biotin carboxylase subunit [Eubacterium sp.]